MKEGNLLFLFISTYPDIASEISNHTQEACSLVSLVATSWDFYTFFNKNFYELLKQQTKAVIRHNRTIKKKNIYSLITKHIEYFPNRMDVPKIDIKKLFEHPDNSPKLPLLFQILSPTERIFVVSWAIEENRIDILKNLFNSFLKDIPGFLKKRKYYFITHSVKHGHVEIVRYLCESLGSYESIETFLKSLFYIFYKPNCFYLLCLAAQNGHIEVLKYLINLYEIYFNISEQFQNDDFQSIFEYAAKGGQLLAVKFLFETFKSNLDLIPTNLVKIINQTKSAEIARWILNSRSIETARMFLETNGYSCLVEAIKKKDRFEMVECLLSYFSEQTRIHLMSPASKLLKKAIKVGNPVIVNYFFGYNTHQSIREYIKSNQYRLLFHAVHNSCEMLSLLFNYLDPKEKQAVLEMDEEGSILIALFEIEKVESINALVNLLNKLEIQEKYKRNNGYLKQAIRYDYFRAINYLREVEFLDLQTINNITQAHAYNSLFLAINSNKSLERIENLFNFVGRENFKNYLTFNKNTLVRIAISRGRLELVRYFFTFLNAESIQFCLAYNSYEALFHFALLINQNELNSEKQSYTFFSKNEKLEGLKYLYQYLEEDKNNVLDAILKRQYSEKTFLLGLFSIIHSKPEEFDYLNRKYTINEFDLDSIQQYGKKLYLELKESRFIQLSSFWGFN